MDVLTQLQTKTSDSYLSRFNSFYFGYNTLDDKYVYGLISQLDKNCPYVVHKIEQKDNLDSLASKYYGRPDYYWIIGLFNDIEDCFEELWGKYTELKIPTLSSLKFASR